MAERSEPGEKQICIMKLSRTPILYFWLILSSTFYFVLDSGWMAYEERFSLQTILATQKRAFLIDGLVYLL